MQAHEGSTKEKNRGFQESRAELLPRHNLGRQVCPWREQGTGATPSPLRLPLLPHRAGILSLPSQLGRSLPPAQGYGVGAVRPVPEAWEVLHSTGGHFLFVCGALSLAKSWCVRDKDNSPVR